MLGVQTQASYDDARAVLDQELLDCAAAANGDQSLISQCNSDYVAATNALPAVGDTIKSNDWKLANKVTFSYMDLNGTGHMFEDVEVGQLLDMVCEDGSGFMVAKITGINIHGTRTKSLTSIRFSKRRCQRSHCRQVLHS